MFRDQIINDYFEWLWNFTKCRGHSQNRKIITLLHNIEFRYSIPMDANREEARKLAEEQEHNDWNTKQLF